MKKRFVEIEKLHEFVDKLKPCTYKYVPPYSDGKTHFGFIAQDLLEIFPIDKFAVVGMKDGHYTVNKGELIAILTRYVQHLDKEIIELKKEVEELKNAKVCTDNN